METSASNLNSGQMVLGILVSVSELAQSSVLALKVQIAVLSVIDAFVYGSESIDFLEVIEIHPENTIVARSVESNLISQFICPEWLEAFHQGAKEMFLFPRLHQDFLINIFAKTTWQCVQPGLHFLVDLSLQFGTVLFRILKTRQNLNFGLIQGSKLQVSFNKHVFQAR